MSLWQSVKDWTAKAGAAALVAGHQAKLRADLLLADRELSLRKYRFGVELYDYVAPLATQPNFWIDDDILTSTIRPALLEAQREISLLELRRIKQKEKISLADVARQSAFPKKADNLGEKVVHAGLAAGHAGNAAKLQAELAITDAQIKGYKEEFGVRIYDLFAELEDTQGWLPTERTIRSMYDQARRDLEKIEGKKGNIEGELNGSTPSASKSVSVNMNPPSTDQPSWVNTTNAPTATTSFGANNGMFTPPVLPKSTYGSNNGTLSASISQSHTQTFGQPMMASGSWGHHDTLQARDSGIGNKVIYGVNQDIGQVNASHIYGGSSERYINSFQSQPGSYQSSNPSYAYNNNMLTSTNTIDGTNSNFKNHGLLPPTHATPVSYGSSFNSIGTSRLDGSTGPNVATTTGYSAPVPVVQQYDPFSLYSSQVTPSRKNKPSLPSGSDLLDFNYQD
jgi:hypothetical protein